MPLLLFGEMTVEENAIAATFAECKAAFGEVYGYFPVLSERRSQQAGYSSGGEQQLLALGRALVADPEMILLDEPSLGLAPLIVRNIFHSVEHINRDRNVSILLVKQYAVSVLKHAPSGYVVENSRTVVEGCATELSANEDIQKCYLGVDRSAG